MKTFFSEVDIFKAVILPKSINFLSGDLVFGDIIIFKTVNLPKFLNL